ncbi:serine hydrolase [Streptomyces botrytidirepellens]|uniref:serine hydrolase n=1 Tax=Streptomyces botrytidirepellens TaxID=2486417 RepID=UPI001FE44761|nr:serine hydrolase [Streptomyces botrytidirepellens]
METDTSGGLDRGRGPGRRARRPAVIAVVAALAMSLLGCGVGTSAPTSPTRTQLRPSAGPRCAAGDIQGGDVDRVTEVGAPSTASVAPPAASPRTLRQALGHALAPVTRECDGEFAVALLDTRSGASAAYGNRTYDTASIVKVGILAALLLKAQDERRGLTAKERDAATVMIEHSDNGAATALWKVIGGADGFDAAQHRLGLTHTRGGRAGLWGLTRTTATDQLRLLRAVFGDGSALNANSQAYIRTLMGRITTGQDWGVSAAADAGAGTRLKNGWLPRSTTGLWDVNSIGQVTASGRTFLVAVLSDGSKNMNTGVALVEQAARAAVGAAATLRA